MVKHLLNASNRNTIIAIKKNSIIQHFLRFDSMIFEAPLNASFVEKQKADGMKNIEKINNLIFPHLVLHMKKSSGFHQANLNENSDAGKESTYKSHQRQNQK
jgi:hypothetical protein